MHIKAKIIYDSTHYIHWEHKYDLPLDYLYILNTDLECTYINISTLDIIEIIILLRVLEHHVFE